jgi:hypothetical protein
MSEQAGEGEGATLERSLRGDAGEFGGLPIRERYGLVLLLIFVGYLMAGVDPSPSMSALTSLLWVVLLLATLWSPGIPSRLRRLGLAATALVLVTTISLGLVATDVAEGWRLLILAVALLAALLAILFRILQHERVSAQSIMGGISAYALIAFAMSAVYHGLDLLSGADFLNGVVGPGDYTYFSFVTLTTVGYGDITAASDIAKRLVVVEAFVGQVFLITLVARLVSLWGKRLR